VRTFVEVSGEKGTGASDEPRPGGFRSCTEELDSSGRMDGGRRSEASEGCPLNKGGRRLLLAKRINREVLVFGRVTGDNHIRVGIRVGCPWSDMERQTSVGSGKGCLDP
jgi:hypothetical protein